MQHVLVTGGAGYIGSHVTRALLEQGYEVTVVDDLSQGHRDNVPAGKLVELRLSECLRLADLMREMQCAAVLHLAGSACVEESMREPGRYYDNNVAGTLSLLMAMDAAGVKRIVFSSSAAVYGIPEFVPIMESDPLQPCNPYGATKAVVEGMLRWFDQARGIRYAALRYFNVAGAGPGLAERHDPETHLIPRLLQAAATGGPVMICGTDYGTTDGTCVRDFVHVVDLADAHVLALQHLLSGSASQVWNVGTGRGHSLLDVVEAVTQVTGKPVQVIYGERRPGDPPMLVSASGRIFADLGWKPRYDLNSMVEHAWRAAHPD